VQQQNKLSISQILYAQKVYICSEHTVKEVAFA